MCTVGCKNTQCEHNLANRTNRPHKPKTTPQQQQQTKHKDDVTSVACRGHDILGASVDGTVRRFDLRLGRCYADDLRHPVTCARVTSDGLCVLAACLDSAIRLLDKATGELLATYRGHRHEGVKMGAALLPGDSHVVGCGEDGERVVLCGCVLFCVRFEGVF